MKQNLIMKPKRIPSTDELTMLDAVFSLDQQKWKKWCRSQGFEPDEDLPVDLSSYPCDEWIENTKVMPTKAIKRYIESEDILTNHTIDMMEIALERDYGVKEPWIITSMRSGNEQGGTLSVSYFYLIQER